MFEPVSVPIEMLSLTLIAAQARGEELETSLKIRDLQHYPLGVSLLYPNTTPILLQTAGAIPASNCYVATFISFNQIFLGDAQAVGGVEPAGLLSPVVQIGFLVQGSGVFQPLTGPLQFQTALNAPFLLVFPPNCFPTLNFITWNPPAPTNRADFRWNGYLLPAGKQPVFQGLSTVFSSA